MCHARTTLSMFLSVSGDQQRVSDPLRNHSVIERACIGRDQMGHVRRFASRPAGAPGLSHEAQGKGGEPMH